MSGQVRAYISFETYLDVFLIFVKKNPLLLKFRKYNTKNMLSKFGLLHLEVKIKLKKIQKQKKRIFGFYIKYN